MQSSDESALDIERLRGWIGREETVSQIVGEDLARKYHATFDLAGEAPKAGEIVPRLIHFCLTQPAAPTARLGEDGHPQRGEFLPPVPLPRRMWAGGSVLFHGDLRVGDRTRRRSRIEDVMLKQGRSGALCFVTVRHRIDVNGAPVLEETQDIVYREADAPGAAHKLQKPAEPGVHRKPMRADPPLLFRYSALTFNSHRIHYDRRYAMAVEGYPGLVIHGPLQAALLAHYATELHGTPPKRFGFRGMSPLFDEDAFALHAVEEGDRLKLWTARDGGPIGMMAEAAWS